MKIWGNQNLSKINQILNIMKVIKSYYVIDKNINSLVKRIEDSTDSNHFKENICIIKNIPYPIVCSDSELSDSFLSALENLKEISQNDMLRKTITLNSEVVYGDRTIFSIFLAEQRAESKNKF